MRPAIRHNNNNTYVSLEGTNLGESSSGLAVRFRYTSVAGTPCPGTTEWFPLSQVQKSFVNPNESGADWIMVSEWLLDQKGIKYEHAPNIPTVQTSTYPAGSQAQIQNTFDDYDGDIPF